MNLYANIQLQLAVVSILCLYGYWFFDQIEASLAKYAVEEARSRRRREDLPTPVAVHRFFGCPPTTACPATTICAPCWCRPCPECTTPKPRLNCDLCTTSKPVDKVDPDDSGDEPCCRPDSDNNSDGNSSDSDFDLDDDYDDYDDDYKDILGGDWYWKKGNVTSKRPTTGPITTPRPNKNDYVTDRTKRPTKKATTKPALTKKPLRSTKKP